MSRRLTTWAVWVFAVTWIVPVLGVFVTSPRPSENAASTGGWGVFADHQVTLDNYREVLSGSDDIAEGIWPLFVNTVVIAVPVVLMGLTLASMAAYVLVWIRFRGAELVLAVVVALHFALQRCFARGLLTGAIVE